MQQVIRLRSNWLEVNPAKQTLYFTGVGDIPNSKQGYAIPFLTGTREKPQENWERRPRYGTCVHASMSEENWPEARESMRQLLVWLPCCRLKTLIKALSRKDVDTVGWIFHQQKVWLNQLTYSHPHLLASHHSRPLVSPRAAENGQRH